jgi:hypothetical protein
MSSDKGNDDDELLRSDDLALMQSVIVEFNYGLEEMDEIYDLEDKLRELLDKVTVGMIDGHEVAMDNSHGFLFLYGRNAEELFKVVHPVLLTKTWLHGATAHLRFGPAGGDDVPEISIFV